MATIGIDVGGTKIYALCLSEGIVVAEERILLDSKQSTVAAIVSAVKRVTICEVHAVGIGVAGLVRHSRGTFVWGPHLPDLDLPLQARVQEALAVPVSVDNDANTALYAELRRGAGQGHKNVLMVTLGTGIGGAIAIDGKIYRGASFAGEWGHMQVEPEGIACACGQRGCWETRASGPSLERLATEAIAADPSAPLARTLHQQAIRAELVVRAAAQGDELALALVAEIGRSLGQGLASLTSIFDPDVFVIGGGLGSIGDLVITPAREKLAEALHGGMLRKPPPIRVAQLGQAAGALGAALMAETLETL